MDLEKKPMLVAGRATPWNRRLQQKSYLGMYRSQIVAGLIFYLSLTPSTDPRASVYFPGIAPRHG